jgi:hypothetical protein
MTLNGELERTRQEIAMVFVKVFLAICRTTKSVCQDDVPQRRLEHIMEIWWLRQDWRAAVGYGRKRYKSRPRILTKQWSTLHSKKRNSCPKNRMIQILSCKAERSPDSHETRHFIEPEN